MVEISAKKLDALIQLYNYTRAQIKEKTGVTNHMLNTLRDGSASVMTMSEDTAKKFANLFSTSLSQLLDSNVSAYDIFVSYLVRTGKYNPARLEKPRRPTLLIERDILNEADHLLRDGEPLSADLWNDMLAGIDELYKNRPIP